MTHALRLTLLTLTLTLTAGCSCGEDPPAPAAAPPVVAAPTPKLAPADTLEGKLEALRAAAKTLPEGAAEREAALPSLVDLARAVGDSGLKANRADVVAAAAELAGEAGADRFAGALLQRATGLLDPTVAGKHHLWALASVREEEGRVLEAVSLRERAVHTEPTTPSEWIGLSRGYLLADRVGPARAAVTRGLRVHADHAGLRVQGAEVMLVSGRAEQALGIVEEILAAQPDDLAARLVQAESLLVLDRAAEAAKVSVGGPEDAWTHVFAAAVAPAGAGRTKSLARAAELAGDCPCTAEERAAIAWVQGWKAGAPIAPRARKHPNAVAPKLAAPKATPTPQ